MDQRLSSAATASASASESTPNSRKPLSDRASSAEICSDLASMAIASVRTSAVDDCAPAAARGSGPCTEDAGNDGSNAPLGRSEEHTSELQSLMRISYAVFCLQKKNHTTT